jgi:RNA polymerase II subunit A small phosphatase-like protein
MSRPLLILDLDETLIYGSTTPSASEPDFRCGDYFIHKRPFVDEFIGACSRPYALAVWTSSTSDYARCLTQRLFVDVPLEFLWARDRCTCRFDAELQDHYWVKDLRKVRRAGFDLSRVLVVDDTPQKLERNYGNLVVVPEFTGDFADRELPGLARYLLSLAESEEDFRNVEKRRWRTAGSHDTPLDPTVAKRARKSAPPR